MERALPSPFSLLFSQHSLLCLGSHYLTEFLTEREEMISLPLDFGVYTQDDRMSQWNGSQDTDRSLWLLLLSGI